VAEIVGTAGAPDSVTTFARVEDLELLELFVKRLSSEDEEANPEWPPTATGMCTVQALYASDVQGSRPLVCAFITMVVEKARRVYMFLRAAGELRDQRMPPPSAKSIAKYRNPIKSGGIYYANNGAPTGQWHPCTIDKDETARQLEETSCQTDSSCRKKV
jgi:hypothetical protein